MSRGVWRVLRWFMPVMRQHAAFCTLLSTDHCTLTTNVASCAGSCLPCGSVVAFCAGSCLSCCSVVAFCVSFTPVFFPLSGKKKRLAVCFVPVPRGRNRHLQVLMPFNGYRALLVHFGTARFFMAIPTGLRRNAGVRSRRRGVRTLLRNHIGFAMLSAGSTLGLRAPDCAKESSTLWTLFTLRRVMLARSRG